MIKHHDIDNHNVAPGAAEGCPGNVLKVPQPRGCSERRAAFAAFQLGFWSRARAGKVRLQAIELARLGRHGNTVQHLQLPHFAI